MEKQIAAMEMFRKMPQAHHWIEEATIADGVDRARFLVLMTAPRLTDRIKSLVLCRTFKDFRAALLRLPGVHAAAMVRWMFS